MRNNCLKVHNSQKPLHHQRQKRKPSNVSNSLTDVEIDFLLLERKITQTNNQMYTKRNKHQK